MKLKDVFLGICIVALLASEIFLFSANRQKDAALTQLNAAKQEATQLRNQLDELKTASATIQNSESDRLRRENAALVKNVGELQNSAAQLRSVNQQLNQQLGTARTAVQLQQEHLQQLQTENQQAAAAQAVEDQAERAGAMTQRNACINNLRQIDGAKQQWALENNKNTDAVPTAQDLLPFFRDNLFPICPSGGVYLINAVGLPPTCSVPGHALP